MNGAARRAAAGQECAAADTPTPTLPASGRGGQRGRGDQRPCTRCGGGWDEGAAAHHFDARPATPRSPRVSSWEKPLAIRSITVAGRVPARNASIAATTSAASTPRAEPAAAHPAMAARAARCPWRRGSGDGATASPPAPQRRAPSCTAEVVQPQRQRANALAGRGKDRVQHRRARNRDRGLADPAPEPAGWARSPFPPSACRRAASPDRYRSCFRRRGPCRS